jgi:hypothetical protein
MWVEVDGIVFSLVFGISSIVPSGFSVGELVDHDLEIS